MKRSTRIAIILVLVALAGIVTLFLSPVPQPQEYHDFADQREFFGIPHFFDVISNLALVVVGIWGLFGLSRQGAAGDPATGPSLFVENKEKWPWAVLFIGTLLTGLGSAYYHWAPSNETLVWDRLPMTIITMSLLAAVISERISVNAGLKWLGPLLVAGMVSVFYWAWTDQNGAGDLRLYGVVQFLPILLIPLLILLFAPRYTATGGYFGALGWYVLSKLAEAWDHQIYALGGLVGGHTLKHLLAAMAVYWLYRMIARRALVPELRPIAPERGGAAGKQRRRKGT